MELSSVLKLLWELQKFDGQKAAERGKLSREAFSFKYCEPGGNKCVRTGVCNKSVLTEMLFFIVVTFFPTPFGVLFV